VRFNAEKKKVGNYHSTPIYSFRMKHTVCGEWIEIRTDPANTAYVVVEGGRKRDTGEDKELQPGEIAIRPGLTQDPAEKDPFAKLEGKVEDKQRARTEASRILELQERQSRDWDDPYEKSKRLRRSFRAERKGLEKLEANREALKDKMSLGFDLVDETEGDRQRAGMIEFGHDQATLGEVAARTTRVRPMFEQKTVRNLPDKKRHDLSRRGITNTRTADLVAQRKTSLRNELTGNTRAAVDPFLNDVGDDEDIWRPSIKRKKPSSPPDLDARLKVDASSSAEATSFTDKQTPPTATAMSAAALVGYSSDTE
jgi:coiled-coil domain-containing protein 130